MRAIENFEKLLKTCLDIDLKMLFSKHWVSHAKNYVHEVKNSITSSKKFKNGTQIVKNENFQQQKMF